jgi:hypothetical protein
LTIGYPLATPNTGNTPAGFSGGLRGLLLSLVRGPPPDGVRAAPAPEIAS